jgi:murein peptide amidase A
VSRPLGAIAVVLVAIVCGVAVGGPSLADAGQPESALSPGKAFDVGRSVKGRPITVHRFGRPSAEFKALIVGSIHGDESQGMRVVRRLNRLARRGIRDVDLWTIRTVNPDGIARRTRKNAHGVDLNRNFPYRFDPDLEDGYESGPRPLSEPESRTVARIARGRDFDLSIWFHQPWGRALIPCDRTGRFARRYARLSGLGADRGCDKPYPGSAIDWLHHRFGTAAFVAEFGPGRIPGRQVERHARAVVRLMKAMR